MPGQEQREITLQNPRESLGNLRVEVRNPDETYRIAEYISSQKNPYCTRTVSNTEFPTDDPIFEKEWTDLSKLDNSGAVCMESSVLISDKYATVGRNFGFLSNSKVDKIRAILTENGIITTVNCYKDREGTKNELLIPIGENVVMFFWFGPNSPREYIDILMKNSSPEERYEAHQQGIGLPFMSAGFRDGQIDNVSDAYHDILEEEKKDFFAFYTAYAKNYVAVLNAMYMMEGTDAPKLSIVF